MASCKTEQWAPNAPYVKLNVITESTTDTKAILAWRLEYIADGPPAATLYEKAYTVLIADTIVDTGSYDINGKAGVNVIASGTHTVTKASATKSIDFELAFAINSYDDNNEYIGTLTASGSVPVDPTTVYTACGIPTGLSVIDNGNNTVTLSCKIGINGTNTTADGVEMFITCDGTTPSTSNYTYKYRVYGSTGTVVSKVISFAGVASATMASFLGSDYIGDIKFTARTTSDTGNKYSSSTTVPRGATFTWHGKTIPPRITTPSSAGDTTGTLTSYRVTWNAGAGGANNALSKYSLAVYNITTDRVVATYTTTNLYYDVPASNFVANNTYRFDVTTIGTISGFEGQTAKSGRLTVLPIGKFSAPVVTVSDGTTVPSICMSGDRTYVDIGSGNILKLSWITPTAANNEVDGYSITINSYDPDSGTYKVLFSNDIGEVNEFYLNSSHLANTEYAHFPMRASLVARSKYGTAYSSASANVDTYISKGCGTYVKVTDGYKQPVLKRTLAFAKLNYLMLTDSEGKALKDADGKTLYAKAARAQDVNVGWALMQEFSAKDVDNAWRTGDIQYELLTDKNGEIIVDSNNEPIYTL